MCTSRFQHETNLRADREASDTLTMEMVVLLSPLNLRACKEMVSFISPCFSLQRPCGQSSGALTAGSCNITPPTHVYSPRSCNITPPTHVYSPRSWAATASQAFGTTDSPSRMFLQSGVACSCLPAAVAPPLPTEVPLVR